MHDACFRPPFDASEIPDQKVHASLLRPLQNSHLDYAPVLVYLREYAFYSKNKKKDLIKN